MKKVTFLSFLIKSIKFEQLFFCKNHKNTTARLIKLNQTLKPTKRTHFIFLRSNFIIFQHQKQVIINFDEIKLFSILKILNFACKQDIAAIYFG
jgi:hypothetical protein